MGNTEKAVTSGLDILNCVQPGSVCIPAILIIVELIALVFLVRSIRCVASQRQSLVRVLVLILAAALTFVVGCLPLAVRVSLLRLEAQIAALHAVDRYRETHCLRPPAAAIDADDEQGEHRRVIPLSDLPPPKETRVICDMMTRFLIGISTQEALEYRLQCAEVGSCWSVGSFLLPARFEVTDIRVWALQESLIETASR